MNDILKPPAFISVGANGKLGFNPEVAEIRAVLANFMLSGKIPDAGPSDSPNSSVASQALAPGIAVALSLKLEFSEMVDLPPNEVINEECPANPHKKPKELQTEWTLLSPNPTV
jgi:hypothetical protein